MTVTFEVTVILASTMAKNGTNFLSEYSGFLDSSGRHLTYAVLSTYRNFENELSGKEKQFLKAHLDSCPACAARLQEVEEVEQEEERSQPKPLLGMTPAVFRYAVAAVMVVAIGAAIYFLADRPQEEIAVKDILPEHSIAQAPPDPAKFVPNQILENFIERTVRSASGISFLAPNIGDTLAPPFTFKWEGVKKGENCTLTIVDNKNGEVWSKTGSSNEIISESILEPGLYYVKLEVNEKLVRVGKFLVVR